MTPAERALVNEVYYSVMRILDRSIPKTMAVRIAQAAMRAVLGEYRAYLGPQKPIGGEG